MKRTSGNPPKPRRPAASRGTGGELPQPRRRTPFGMAPPGGAKELSKKSRVREGALGGEKNLPTFNAESARPTKEGNP